MGARQHKLGFAVAEPDGWFRIQRRVAATDLDRMDEAVLAPDDGPSDSTYTVVAAEIRDSSLFVRAATGGRVDGLWLFAPSFSKKRLLQALRHGLAGLSSGSLAERLGSRELDPVPPVRRPASDGRDRYTEDQLRAVEACCAPGLQVVWGPPGTGKTHVIVAAIRRLVADGRRVLLASNTNIAVDNALERVVSALAAEGDLPPGRVVRVGVPEIPKVADDARVALRAIIDDRLASRRQAIERLARRASELAEAEQRVAERIRAVEDTLGRFDHRRVAEADERLANRDALRSARTAVEETRAALRQAEDRCADAEGAALHARFACEILDEHRALDRASRADRERTALEERRGIRAMLSRSALRQAEQRHRHAVDDAYAAAGARQRTQAVLGSAAVVPAVPAPSSPEFAVADAHARSSLAAAEQGAAVARVHRDEVRAAMATAEATAARWSGTAQPSDDDLHYLAEAERADLPGQQAQLADLREQSSRLRAERDRVDAERQDHEAQANDEGRDHERQVIAGARVVATTLTMLTLKPALTAEGYDYVIVDEAAAAPLPHVAHAVGRAGTGACLLGDYFQNGPVLDQQLGARRKQEPRLVELFETDCFTCLGLTEPRAAQRSAGCVVLTKQHRFGPNVAELVNRTTYGSVLRTADDAPPSDVVVLDVNGLPGALTHVRRAPGATYEGSWPIGALLARALGEHHLTRGESLGVIAPYTTQVEATTKLLDETEAGAAIDVGTSHRFQGREFDVVVFDMLEIGGKPGWVAQGAARPKGRLGARWPTSVHRRRDPQQPTPVHPGQRRRSDQDPQRPLAHLRDKIERGEVEVVQASRALGIDEPDPAVSSAARDDIQAALKPYVRVVDIHDQEHVLEAVRARIDSARSRLWVWSPWIGRHTAALQDALVAAQKRGVDVRLVALPDEELKLPNRQALDALRDRVQHVVTVARMHQKIVIVDDRWSFVGSMNLLSYGPTPSRRRHDLMVEIESRSFASDLLDHEWAHELAKPPACPRCRIEIRDVRHYAGGRSGGTRGWHWVCRVERDGRLCRQRVAFAKNPSLVDWEPIPQT